MLPSRTKLMLKKNAVPKRVELRLAQTFYDIEKGTTSINKRIAPLRICGVREYKVKGTRKAMVIFVPFAQLTAYHRIHNQLISALEKKFTNRHIVLVAKRRIIPAPRPGKKYTQPRPRSRTLADVQEKILDDIVYPAEIVGKRIRYRTDGSSFIKVHLERNMKPEIEPRLDSIRKVYEKLTGKEVRFEFPL